MLFMACSEDRYYMSVDGGGSKLSIILFDEQLNLVGRAMSGAINPLFVSDQLILRHFEDGIEGCLRNSNVTRIEKLYIAMPGPADLFASILGKKVVLSEHQRMSEGMISLLSGIFTHRGVVALAGTGNGIFNVNGRDSTHMGGWGGLFDDEGSGYSIGRAALSAAVKSFEKRGTDTILPNLITEEWHLSNFRQVVHHVYKSDNYRGLVASLTNLVVDAAQSDAVSEHILLQAGQDMAQQVVSLFRRDGIPADVPIMVAGSVWKDNPVMFRSFYQKVTADLPDSHIYFPWYEPVIGGVVASQYEKHQQLSNAQLTHVMHAFPDYRYKVGRSTLLLEQTGFQQAHIGIS